MNDKLSADLASLRIPRGERPGGSGARKVVVWAIVLGGVGAGGWFAFQEIGARIYKAPVELTEVVLVSPVQSSILATSTGYVVPEVWTRVGPKVPGRLGRVLVKEGDVVEAGAVVAELESAAEESAIAAAESRILVAKAAVETARASLFEGRSKVARARSLTGIQAVPKADLDDAIAREKVLVQSLRAAEAQVAAAESEVEPLRVALREKILVTPIRGTVVGEPARAGETVGTSATGPGHVVEIVDFSSLVVEVDVPETRLGLVRVGGPAEIVLDAYPSKRYRGAVQAIGTRANRAKASVAVEVAFRDEPLGALPEMSARVGFLREELSQEALAAAAKKLVLADAIGERDGRPIVYVVEDGKLRSVEVEVGAADGERVELLDGPPAGARVVRKPTAENFDGQKVKDREGE